MAEIPSIFLPLELRSYTKYRSLSHHKFKAREKLFICQLMEGLLVGSPFNGCSFREISKVYGIRIKLLKFWLLVYRHGASFSDENCPMDEIGVHNVITWFNLQPMDAVTLQEDLFTLTEYELQQTYLRACRWLS